MRNSLRLLALLVAFRPPFAAQEPVILVEAGDPIGAANLVSLELLAASRTEAWPADGTVLYSAETDAPAGTSTFLLATTRHEALGSQTTATLLREGDPEPGNAAALLRAFPDADVTALGQGARAQILVSGADPFSSTHLYWDATPIARSGGTVALPGNHGPNRLVHVLFRHTRANDARQVLVTGVIWPLLADTVPPFPVLLRYQLDASGAVASCEVVLDARGNTPVFPMPYDELPSDGRATDFDAAGGWLTRARGVDGRWRVVRDGVELALEGASAPLAGRLWSALGDDQPVALRASGGVAFVGRVDGDPAEARVLAQDGVVLARQGELLPALAPRTIEPRADTNLFYTEDGELLWLANLSGGGQALLRGREVLLASGALVESRSLLTIEDFVATPDGRFVFLDAVLATGNALVRLDLGAAELVAPCTAPNAGSLSRTAGAVAVGASFEFTLDAPVPVGSLATLRLASLGGSCEASFPFGEVYFDASTTVGRFVVGLTAGAPLTRTIAVPSDLGLLGAEGYCQAAFVTPPGAVPRIVLTNGLRLEVGAP